RMNVQGNTGDAMTAWRRLPALCALLAVSAALRAELPAPDDDPAAWLLAFVDVETTGLTPGFHEMIDVGVILTDLEGKEIDRLFLRIMPKYRERTSPEAVAVNGFSVERWERLNASSAVDAVESLLRFHRRHGAGKRILIVAHNAQFDAAFL